MPPKAGRAKHKNGKRTRPPKARRAPKPHAEAEQADLRRALQDLAVHQIELKVQNEELRDARSELERFVARYRDLFDYAPLGYVRLDSRGNIQELNHFGARLLGKERRFLSGRSFEQFIAEKDLLAFDLMRKHGIADSKQHRIEVTLKVQPSPILACLTLSAFGDDSRATLIAFEDITDHRMKEEALARSERALREADHRKDDFIATLSHELRNPLAAIHLGLQVISRREPASDQYRRAKVILERQVHHLTRLVDDLLDVSRITQGKVQLHREQIDVALLLQRAVEDSSARFESAGIGVEIAIDAGPIWIDADPVRMVQAVENLLGNAAKFTPHGQKVTVSLHGEGGRAVLRVRDTGAGIAADMLERLFEPFSQAPQTLDRSQGGLGLGLALVKGLVEAHGGRVTVASAGLGQGSEFTVAVPRVEAPEVRLSEPGAQTVRALRILLVEDHADFAEVLCDSLQLAGHSVRVAPDGLSAVALARELSPDLVLCDLSLPGMDGYDVARAFRKDRLLKRTYLVALSGDAQPGAIQNALDAGFDQHVAKPPGPDVLNAILAAVSLRPKLLAGLPAGRGLPN